MIFIARDAEASGDLITWWDGEPDGDCQIVCDAQEVALVLGEDDEVLQTLGAGRHAVQVPANAAIAFVTVAAVNLEAEGTFDETGDALVSLAARVRVTDPVKMLGLLDDLGEDESLEGWLGDELMLHAIAAAGEAGIDASSMSSDPALCEKTAARAREVLAPYGVEVLSVASISVG